MNSSLTREKQRALCRELGGAVKLSLIFKASIHGFTAAAFHQRCDTRWPTVSVGYNSSANVFGGYTSAPFSQTGQYVPDQKAFLFTFKGDKLMTYPPVNSAIAVRMVNSNGPQFGNSLVLMQNSQPVVMSNPGNPYNFPAAEMHSNNLQLMECEVYLVEVCLELETPWRTVVWESERRRELMDSIRANKPLHRDVSQARVLLVGPVGAGKSSFFNSINSVFKGHVTSQAIAGSSASSLTTRFRTYSVKDGRDGKPLPIILCDTRGLEESTGTGLDIDDISSILKGHMPDSYQFNSAAPLQSDTHGYRPSPQLCEQVHCVVYVLDACKISIMPDKLEGKLTAVRRKANLMGIPQLALITKVDEACPLVKEDLTRVYRSPYIKHLLQEAGARLGLPVSCVLPVKNYSEEVDLQLSVDVLLLSALLQMLHFSDNFLDELSDRLDHAQIKSPRETV